MAPGRITSTAAAHTVSSEKKPTFTSASFSIRVYPPPTRTVIVIARQIADPDVDRHRRHEQVQDLRHAPVHAADLQHREEHGDRPRPDQPAHTEARSRHAVEPLEAGVAGGDRVAPELALDHGLDGAAHEDDPQRREADLRAERRRGDELARADDGRGQDHARADATKRREHRRRRRLDGVRGEDVGIS